MIRRSQLPRSKRRRHGGGVVVTLAACVALVGADAASATGTIETAPSDGRFPGLWSATFPPDTKPAGTIAFRRLTGAAENSAGGSFTSLLRDCVRREGTLLYRGSYDYGGRGRVEACEDPAAGHTLRGYYVNRGGVRKAGHGTFTLTPSTDASGRERFSGTYSTSTTNTRRVRAETTRWRGLRRSTFSQVTFSFRGYANNVRVVPPLIGEFQLGRSDYRGSGTADLATGAVTGSLVDHDDLKRSTHRITEAFERVISVRRRTGFVRLVLRVRVARTSHPRSCPVATRGTLTIVDDEARLENGHPRDSIAVVHPRAGGPTKARDGGAACRTHVHGFDNTDGGARTDPAVGGPPGGGQWAIVTIALS